MLSKNTNDENRQAWLTKTLAALPAGSRILDAGAGELRNRAMCGHLAYVSQDFCQYDGGGDGRGLQTENGILAELIWCATSLRSLSKTPPLAQSSAARCLSICQTLPRHSMNLRACSNPEGNW